MDFVMDLLGGKSLQDNITNYYLRKHDDKMMAFVFVGKYIVTIEYCKAEGLRGREDYLQMTFFMSTNCEQLWLDIVNGIWVDVDTQTLYNIIFTMNPIEVVDFVKNKIKTAIINYEKSTENF